MSGQCVSHARSIALISLIAFTGMQSAAAATDTLNAVSSGGYGQLGQLYALTDDRTRMADYRASIVPAQVALASVYLHYYPESLADDGSVEAYTRQFFTDEFTQTQRSEEYRSSPFKRRSIVAGWRTRLQSMKTTESLTLNIFLPVMLNTNKYDFEKQAFPLTFALTEEAVISSGVLGLRCLKLDRTFRLDTYEVAETDAKAFMARNRNSRIADRGASIFVGVQLKITGKPETKGAARPRCQLAAEVVSIDALEYLSNEDYSESYASPGAVMTAYYSHTSAVAADAAVQIPYDRRTVVADAPAEAQAFNLETRKGLTIMPPKDVRPSWLGANAKILEALMDYGDFLALGVYPEAFVKAGPSRCMTRTYLTAEDDALYFGSDPRARGWSGATEFEKRRTDVAFKADALPKLLARAVKTPQRYLILGDVTLPEYDFEQNGFHFANLNSTASMSAIFGHCNNRIGLLPMADQLHEFWSISPADAEVMLDSMPVSRTVGTRNTRTAYLATEVELVNLKSARPLQHNASFIEQPPLRVKIISSRLYADKELTQEIFSPPIIRAAPSVLEAGIPDSVTNSKSYQIEYGREGNLLQQLKARGTFEEWEWPQLLAQQKLRDTWYYSLMRPNYRPHQVSPVAPYEQDPHYTPFFPHGTEDRKSGLRPHTMTEAQMALFIEWSKKQANALY